MISTNTDSYVPEFLVAGIGIFARVYILDINILLRQLKKRKTYNNKNN